MLRKNFISDRFLFPKTNHNSSAKCGAKGDNKIDNGFNTLDEEHFFQLIYLQESLMNLHKY